MIDRILHAIRRRPVRVAEAVLALAAALGASLAPDVEQAIVTLAVALVGILGGETAQTLTTPVADPRIPDGHEGEADE